MYRIVVYKSLAEAEERRKMVQTIRKSLCLLALILALGLPIFAQGGIDFDTPVSVGPPLGANLYPFIKFDGHGHGVAMWQYSPLQAGQSDLHFKIMICHSLDNGTSWSAPVYLHANPDTNPISSETYPSMANDGQRNWIVLWHDGGKIQCARSSDNGTTWTPTATLTVDGLNMGFSPDANARIDTDGQGTWITTWIRSDYSDTPRNTAVMISRSLDNGISWSTPLMVSDRDSSNYIQIFESALATDGAGNWVALWPDYEPVSRNMRIMATHSGDNGKTWSAPMYFADSNTMGYTGLRVTTDKKGHWLAAWGYHNRQTSSGPVMSQGIQVATSVNNGTSWTEPRLIYVDTKIDQLPIPTMLIAPYLLMTNREGLWILGWLDLHLEGTYLAYSLNEGVNWKFELDNRYVNFDCIGQDRWITAWEKYISPYSSDILIGKGRTGTVPVEFSGFSVD